MKRYLPSSAVGFPVVFWHHRLADVLKAQTQALSREGTHPRFGLGQVHDLVDKAGATKARDDVSLGRAGAVEEREELLAEGGGRGALRLGHLHVDGTVVAVDDDGEEDVDEDKVDEKHEHKVKGEEHDGEGGVDGPQLLNVEATERKRSERTGTTR